MDKIEEFENTLKELGCVLVDPAEYPEAAIKFSKGDTGNFLEIIKTFSGKTIVFYVISNSMYYMVVYHGILIELEMAFEEETNVTESTKG
jgi:hypothetical protein